MIIIYAANGSSASAAARLKPALLFSYPASAVITGSASVSSSALCTSLSTTKTSRQQKPAQTKEEFEAWYSARPQQIQREIAEALSSSALEATAKTLLIAVANPESVQLQSVEATVDKPYFALL